MIVGSDLQSLAELKRRPGLFGNRAVFTARERAHCEGRRDPWASLGGILCAKEAFIKALSAFEDLPPLTFLDLEIRHAENGRPLLHPGERLGRWLSRRRLAVDVSISHSGEYATATVLIGKKRATRGA
ncbi:MAG: holo-ACP synthase [Labilithrix sp.]|nr:holo-ACP synthase [Labilithrix sp.]